MKDVEGHEWLGIDTTDGGRTFIAVCSCGWRSRPYSGVQLVKSSLIVVLVSAYVSLLLVVVPAARWSGTPLFCGDAAACAEPSEQRAVDLPRR